MVYNGIFFLGHTQCEYSPVFAARMRPTQLAMSLVVVLEPEKSFFGRSFELWDRWCRWTHGDAAERIVWSAVHLYGARRPHKQLSWRHGRLRRRVTQSHRNHRRCTGVVARCMCAPRGVKAGVFARVLGRLSVYLLYLRDRTEPVKVPATSVLGTESDPSVRSEATFQPLVTSVLNIRTETDTGTVHIHIPTYFTV